MINFQNKGSPNFKSISIGWNILDVDVMQYPLHTGKLRMLTFKIGKYNRIDVIIYIGDICDIYGIRSMFGDKNIT